VLCLAQVLPVTCVSHSLSPSLLFLSPSLSLCQGWNAPPQPLSALPLVRFCARRCRPVQILPGPGATYRWVRIESLAGVPLRLAQILPVICVSRSLSLSLSLSSFSLVSSLSRPSWSTPPQPPCAPPPLVRFSACRCRPRKRTQTSQSNRRLRTGSIRKRSGQLSRCPNLAGSFASLTLSLSLSPFFPQKTLVFKPPQGPPAAASAAAFAAASGPASALPPPCVCPASGLFGRTPIEDLGRILRPSCAHPY